MNTKLSLLCAFIAGSMHLGAQITAQAVPQGTLVLTVKDKSGAFIPSLPISYSRLPVLSSVKGTLAPGEFRYSGTIVTGTGPTSLNLPVGKYRICAITGITSYLDVCKWATAISATVVATQSTPVLVPLAKGVRLNVSISDMQHVLPPDKRPVGPPPVIVGVLFGNGAFLAADCTVSIVRLACSMAVPIGLPMNLLLANPTLGLAAEDGTTVAENGVGPAFQASGLDLQFNFNVLGSKLKGVLP